ncbi:MULTISPECIES: ABC transporter permease [Gracilibacillus]|uniref:ABC transporter permease n=1 Tax=Gracilibacillus TaxID=74385 RepID=UPI0008260A09|nr:MULTISPECIES: ABC transporter permease [Gracilibacillus]
MNKFWTVFSHTFSSKIKSKSFIITTALFIAFIFLMSNFDSIINVFDSDESEESGSDQIALVTEEDAWAEMLQAGAQGEVELERFEGTSEEAQTATSEEEYSGVLEVTESNGLPEAIYYSTGDMELTIPGILQSQLQQLKVAVATEEAGVESDVVASINEPVSFQQEVISTDSEAGEGEKSMDEMMGARALVYVILFLLYFSVISYGNMIAMDIANEKTSRVMEILISSSSPVSQMFAKILAIGLAGLVQMLLFCGVGYYMLIQQQEDGFLSDLGLNDVSPSTFVYAVIFFILGYFLYATLAAMLGSLVSRTEDVQQLMMPVTLLIVLAFFIAMFGLAMPESPLVVISSYIPFFSPMTMFLRVGVLDIPFWEIAISIALLVAAILLLAALGARIYRGGVLMYGTSTSLKDFKKALQLSKK